MTSFERNESVRRHFLEGQPFQNNYPGPVGSALAQFQSPPPDGLAHNYVNQGFAAPLQSQITRMTSPPAYHYQQTAAVLAGDTTTECASVYGGYDDAEGEEAFTDVAPANAADVDNDYAMSFKDPYWTDPCSQTGFGQITPVFMDPSMGYEGGIKNSATGNPLLDIANRPVDQFSRNNMVPFFGSKLTQNMEGTGVPQAGDGNTCDGVGHTGTEGLGPFQRRLELFTGTDEMWQHKREAGPMFSPAEQQTTWINGMPLFRPDEQRYKDSLWRRNNESPIEKQQVGPGIALDYSVPAAGGFHQFTRILPNNVNGYRRNQLENLVKAGKWVYSNKPTSQFVNGVSNNRPKMYLTQTRRPTMPTTFTPSHAASADAARLTNYAAQTLKGRQARVSTESSAGYGELRPNLTGDTEDGIGCVVYNDAPVGMAMTAAVKHNTNAMSSYEAGLRHTFKRGVMGCLEREQGSDRYDLWSGPTSHVAHGTNREGYFANFTNRGDVNPYVINISGTATTGGEGVWQPTSFLDSAKTTRKEMSLFANNGTYVKPHITFAPQRPQDSPQTTRKEMLHYSYQGPPSNTGTGKPGNFTVRLQDELRTTTKETNHYASNGNLTGSGARAPTDRFMFTGGVVPP